LCCEDYTGKTHPDVVHAEDDAIFLALTYHEDLSEMVLYVTRQPCLLCSQLIVEHGIKSVYYRDADDKTDGIEHLAANGVFVSSAWLVGQSWAERWQ
jgi:dCMP deaminase